MTRRSTPAIDRFLSHVAFADQWYDNGTVRTRCLVWTASKRTGYGRFLDGRGVLTSAHRWAYEHWTGGIKRGNAVDHLCHNADASCQGGFTCPHRACCNPLHLQSVRQRTNLMRGDGTAQRNRLKTHCPQNHPYDEINTKIVRGKHGLQRLCRVCVKEHGRRHYEKAKLRRLGLL